MIQPDYSTSTIRIARVTHVHPEGQAIDVIFLDTGDFGRNVQVMSPMAGTDFGFTSGIPAPEEEGHEPNLSDDPDKRTITCVVASVGGVHICLGFLYPQVTEMAFTKESHPNRTITRYPSDVYTTVDDDANAFIVHPRIGSVFIGMGEGALGKPKLEGEDFDGRFKLKHNTKEKNPSISIQCTYSATPDLGGNPVGGSATVTGGSWDISHVHAIYMTTATYDIGVKSGRDLYRTAARDMRASVGRNYLNQTEGMFFEQVEGTTSRHSGGKHLIQSDTMVHIQAPIIYLDGAVVFGGGVSGAVGGGGTLQIDADIEHTGDMSTTGEHTDVNGQHN